MAPDRAENLAGSAGRRWRGGSCRGRALRVSSSIVPGPPVSLSLLFVNAAGTLTTCQSAGTGSGGACPTIADAVTEAVNHYRGKFDAVWQGEGASILRCPVRAPNTNAIAERWVRTVRSECTDGLLIVNEGHLRRVLDRYVRHYNQHRPHRGLALRPPLPSTPSTPLTPSTPSSPATIASIRRQEVLGGLINEYHAA